MIIETMDFGFVEIREEDIINFPLGVYAFREHKKFVVLQNPDSAWMLHLQSIDGPKPRFILLDPYMFVSDYSPILPSEADEIFGTRDPSKLSIFVIAFIPGNIRDMTVNFKSPIIIDFDRKIGAQLILENPGYEVRTRLFGSEDE
ncbi:MAG TPA: flagellar assembly protein FliW [Bacillota bacterium]|nr:flagellar assembly protein FliW [Clostridiales bacterium]HPT85447.1 flagellar assembly protein FliW [Bacillota bacterium]